MLERSSRLQGLPIYEALLDAFDKNEKNPCPETICHVWSLLCEVPIQYYQLYPSLRASVIDSLRYFLCLQGDAFDATSKQVGLRIANHVMDAFLDHEEHETDFEEGSHDDLHWCFLLTLEDRLQCPEDYDSEELDW